MAKDVMQFWKKRDRELADLKRKKEKFDKEMRKKQQEEEEQLLQKKRLEYLMKQSEIYAHFMANKMGMGQEHKQEQNEQLQAENELGVGRVAVDEASARRKMAKMINEDRERLIEFDGSQASQIVEDDLDVNKFDTDNQ
jgi:DNA helicase INO80